MTWTTASSSSSLAQSPCRRRRRCRSRKGRRQAWQAMSRLACHVMSDPHGSASHPRDPIVRSTPQHTQTIQAYAPLAAACAPPATASASPAQDRCRAAARATPATGRPPPSSSTHPSAPRRGQPECILGGPLLRPAAGRPPRAAAGPGAPAFAPPPAGPGPGRMTMQHRTTLKRRQRRHLLRAPPTRRCRKRAALRRGAG